VSRATRELDAPVRDVWAFLAEPFHLPDWWQGYSGVQPDRRGLASGARWQVRRSRAAGLLRKPGGEGLILIRTVDPPYTLAWHDVQQKLDITVTLESAGERTLATVNVGGSPWRLVSEGARSLPKHSLDRLASLIQTSGSL
jgi:uncharacterized protein YndB with AHSA1/START domain